MKKKVFVFMLAALVMSPLFGTQAFAEQSVSNEPETLEEQSVVDPEWTPVSRIWYETLPIPYDGRSKYIRTTRYYQCFEGYIYADLNVGLGHYVYSGFLYPCDG